MKFSFKKWQYTNTTLLILSLVIFFFLSETNFIKDLIIKIGELGYLGAFLVGIFFVSIFTVAPASVILFYLAKNNDPFLTAVFAGMGAVVGDYLIFRFLKDKVFEELHPVFNKIKGSYFHRLFHTPYFSWLLPVIGATIIASPLPDEIGITLMGLSRVKGWQFIVITFILNTIGILAIIGLAKLF
jgi:membrane protein YqaA with SNARE-associated domain